MGLNNAFYGKFAMLASLFANIGNLGGNFFDRDKLSRQNSNPRSGHKGSKRPKTKKVQLWRKRNKIARASRQFNWRRIKIQSR